MLGSQTCVPLPLAAIKRASRDLANLPIAEARTPQLEAALASDDGHEGVAV